MCSRMAHKQCLTHFWTFTNFILLKYILILSENPPIELSSELLSKTRQPSITWQVICIWTFENASHITNHVFVFMFTPQYPAYLPPEFTLSLIFYPLKSPSRIEHNLWAMKSKYKWEWKNGSKLLKWHHLFINWISTYPFFVAISVSIFKVVLSEYIPVYQNILFTHYMKYYQDKSKQLIKYTFPQVKNVASIHFNCLNLLIKFLEVFINLYIFCFILLLLNLFLLSLYFKIYE